MRRAVSFLFYLSSLRDGAKETIWVSYGGGQVNDRSFSREPELIYMQRKKKGRISVFDDMTLISCNVGRLMTSFGLYDHS